MLRYPKHEAEDDGWTRWVYPVHSGYRFACCDCGLVHDMEFAVVDDIGEPVEAYSVAFKVRRNNRSTGQMRRHMQ